MSSTKSCRFLSFFKKTNYGNTKRCKSEFSFQGSYNPLKRSFFGQGGSGECPISDTRYYERHKMNKYKTLMQNLKEIIYLYLLSVMKNNKSTEYKI